MQIYDYFVALDVDVIQSISGRREIAAIGAVALKTGHFDQRQYFAGFCQTESPTVSGNVRRYPFKDIMRNFLSWISQLDGSFVFVTDAYHKLGHDLHNQCSLSGVELPSASHQWLNIIRFWKQRYGNHQISRDMLLEHFDQKFQRHDNEPRSAKWTAMDLANVFVQVFSCHSSVIFVANECLVLI